MMNQREAVFTVVSSVVGDIQPNTKVSLNDRQKEIVHSTLVQMFLNGEAEIKGVRTDDYLKKYVPGLVNNWLRKDLRLNGNTPYVTKNPGSRAGSGDESLKAMRALLAATTDSTARAIIQGEIDKRVSELKPKPTLDISKLPEHLRVWAEQLQATRNE